MIWEENLKDLVKVSLKKRRPRISTTSLEFRERLQQGEKGTGQFHLPKMDSLRNSNGLKLQ